MLKLWICLLSPYTSVLAAQSFSFLSLHGTRHHLVSRELYPQPVPHIPTEPVEEEEAAETELTPSVGGSRNETGTA